MNRRNCLKVAVAILLTAGSSMTRAVNEPHFNVGAQWEDALMVSWLEVEVDATPEQIFAVLSDYDRLAEFIPGVVISRIVARDGVSVQVDQELEESVLFFQQRLKVRMAITEAAPRQMTLKALSGSFRSYEGQYRLLAVASDNAKARTRILYRAKFEPDFDLPRMMGPYVVKRSLEKNHRALVREIERRAGTETSKP
jgi:carbon monoxide dehydrogenase subunit G